MAKASSYKLEFPKSSRELAKLDLEPDFARRQEVSEIVSERLIFL